MFQSTLVDKAEAVRTRATDELDPNSRSALGQFLTPAPIARFMASLFSNLSGSIRVLDPGAGSGSLTAALAQRICEEPEPPASVAFDAWEVDPKLFKHLRTTIDEVMKLCDQAEVRSGNQLYNQDFLTELLAALKHDLFAVVEGRSRPITHVITNPPYKKISSSSPHRRALRSAGLETSNLYTAFMYVAAISLADDGELVAIVPRSFCNGPYFKPFRQKFFSMMSLRHVHVFERRDMAFRDDEVLQENIIIHAVKSTSREPVTITTSQGGEFYVDRDSNAVLTEDMTQRLVDHDAVIAPSDPNLFVHLAVNELEQNVIERMSSFKSSLVDLGIEISTGPVVDFRHKADLRQRYDEESAPLLYPAHFRGDEIEWPKEMRKPNAIHVSEESRKWLWKNQGHFVLTRRFTSKEEPKRVVASVYDSRLPGDLVGFENHLNVFHEKQSGLPASLAQGLALFLNSSLVDRYFRQFNGHTQVNATDLRSLGYPDRQTLVRIGEQCDVLAPSQSEIDSIIERELTHMPHSVDPVAAQQKIEQAIEVLKAMDMPKGQQNERSALTLLALADLKADGNWGSISRPLMGITPIMSFALSFYGREYAPNTRETFRRQTMHQFVEAGIALYNPDQPDRPVNSPKACYQISEEAHAAMREFGTERWDESLSLFLENSGSLSAKWAMHREMEMVPLSISEGLSVLLTPGSHSDLIRQIIEEFGPRYAPGSDILYVGDTGQKVGHFREDRLAELGISIDRHGKMPDVVLEFTKKGWLLLIEAVTSHGPVDGKRHAELAKLFSGSSLGLVYVTAFPDRRTMGQYLSEISWETEVWCADAPTHLIHFDGERFLGPYD